MNIIVKNNQLTPDVFDEMRKLFDVGFKIGITIKLKNIYEEIEKIIPKFDNDRLDVYRKHCVIDENNKFVHPLDEQGNEDVTKTKIIEGQEEKFFEEMNELMNTENVLISPKIKVSELGDETQMSLRTLAILDFMFDTTA